MKSGLTLIILIAVCLFEVNAQTAKGSFMVGGSMNLQRHGRNIPDATSSGSLPRGEFSLSPSIGFFVANNLMIGIQPSYSYMWSLNSPSKYKSFGVGPVVRYYFPIGKFAIFPELSASFSQSSFTGLYYDPATLGTIVRTDKESSKFYRGGLGAAWFVSPNIGIEGIVYYRAITNSNDYASDLKSSRIGVNFGIQFYFPKKTN